MPEWDVDWVDCFVGQYGSVRMAVVVVRRTVQL
jgi:hypothetical protein